MKFAEQQNTQQFQRSLATPAIRIGLVALMAAAAAFSFQNIAFASGIDSGGGAASAGTYGIRCSVGGFISTVPARHGRTSSFAGQVPALFAHTDIHNNRFVDGDGDGLPDWWEEDYLLDMTSDDSQTSLDGNRSTNEFEFLAGTNPRSTESELKISPTWSGGALRFTIPTLSGRNYTLKFSVNLSGWQDVRTIPGNNADQEFVFTPSADDPDFATRETTSRYFLKLSINLD